MLHWIAKLLLKFTVQAFHQVNNCNIIEKQLIKLFKDKFIWIKIAGNEYFEGNLKEMKKEIYNICKDETFNK